MKNMISTAALALLFTLPAHAQIDEVLRSIEQNNTTLKTLTAEAGADKLAARTGISLPDPEVEFARLWGTPTEIGNRTDIAISQGFDIATITGMKARQARRRGELLDLGVASERTRILLEARRLCVEIIHCNRLARELSVRLDHARTLAEGYERRLANGDANRLERDKALLNLHAAESEVTRNEIERRTLLADLARLNGGVEIALNAVDFPPSTLPVDFEAWFADVAGQNPSMEYARLGAEADRREVSLARAEGLPRFSVGYMREKTLGQRYEGVTIGMSIPLFDNRNRVKQARAAYTASKVREHDTHVQLAEQMHALYTRAVGLRAVAEDQRRSLDEATGAELLRKALDAGEISLLDYIVELGFRYDATDRTLVAERDFQLALTTLTAMGM